MPSGDDAGILPQHFGMEAREPCISSWPKLHSMTDRTKQNTNHICFTKEQIEDESHSCVGNLDIWVKSSESSDNFSISVTLLQNEKPKQANTLDPHKSVGT